MLLDGVARRDTVVLVDTNVAMEAVRTRCWKAVTGGLCVETVEECRDEALRGDRGRPGYLPVSEEDLARVRKVHPVTPTRAPETWTVESETCSRTPGRVLRGGLRVGGLLRGQGVRAAVALGWHERMHSLAALAAAVGAHPSPPLLDHFGERWLSQVRTQYLLG